MRLNSIFSDHAVFAADRPISVFGSGKGRATVRLGEVCVDVCSETDTWCIELPGMGYGGPYTLEFSSDEEKKVLGDIYIGEVLLFSGQSNMSFALKESNTPKEYYSAPMPLLRYTKIADAGVAIPWSPADGISAEDWSALGYIAGKECALKKGVAIGVICCSQGASVIESWMPEGTLAKIGIDLSPEQKHLDHYHEVYGQWNSDAFLYRQRLSHIIPYTLSGVVWYQGESDASPEEGALYQYELEALIRIWRSDFKNPALPFVIVQIADTAERIAQGEGWRLVQRAQEEISSLVPSVYTVISRDICETDDIHPKSKYALGCRIAEAITEKIIG